MIVSSRGKRWRSRRCASISTVSSPAWVEAAAMTVRSPIAALSAARLVGVGGRLRHVELEVAGGGDARRAEVADSARHGRPIAPGRDRSSAAARRCVAGANAPALERALRDPAIDQDQRDAALGAVMIRFGHRSDSTNSARSGCQWSRKRVDEARRVERHELVDHARRQPLLGQLGRRDGAGRAPAR